VPTYSHSQKAVALWLKALLDTNRIALGLQKVYLGETNLRPDYPCAIVSAVGLEREVKATHKFSILITTEIQLLVCEINQHDHIEEDVMALIDAVNNVLDVDRTMTATVIFSYVSKEDMTDFAAGAIMLKGATLTVSTLSEETF
jgi:hypothetical protein